MFVCGAGGPQEVELLPEAQPAAAGGMPTPSMGAVPMGAMPMGGGGGYGGAPPPSLVGSVRQLTALTNEVAAIRDSLAVIERGKESAPSKPKGADSGPKPKKRTEEADQKNPVKRKGKMRGLAGVIAARNERDKVRMDELVELVTGAQKCRYS